MDAHPNHDPGRGAQRAARVATWAVIALVLGFNLWTVRSTRKVWNFGQPQKDYYNLLVDGFLDGHTSMKVDVPQELLNLPDPYDPKQRRDGLALHDASLYKGKYYLYFGVTPVVTLLLPFTVLTGIDLPLQLAILIFICGGYLMSVKLWRDLRRTYFAGASPWVEPLGALALGFASMGPVVLRRASVWETPISSGYFFAMTALWCVFRALHAPRRVEAWLAAAGLCFGLAIGSRPTYFFATTALALPLIYWWWCGRAEQEGRWWPVAGWWRRAIAAVAPLAAVGVGLAWYNYARFGSVVEFGVSYELSGVYEGKMRHFSASYVPLNFYRYFLAPPRWTGAFPFLAIEPVTTAPDGYFIGDDMFGLWRNVPFIWLGLAALVAAWRRRATAPALLWWAGAALAVFGGVAGFIVFFYSAMGRYLLDLSPALVLLGCVGLATVEETARGWTRRWARVGARIACGVALAGSVGFAILFSFSFNRELVIRNPATYRAMARWFNQLPQWIGELRGDTYGPVALEVRLAPASPGTEVTLLTSGVAPRTDRVLVRYAEAGKIQIGFAHGTNDEQLSGPLAVDWAVPHRLRAELGSLLPPEEFPASAAWDGMVGGRPTRRLRIEWDGEPVVAGRQRFYPAKPREVVVGQISANDVKRVPGAAIPSPAQSVGAADPFVAHHGAVAVRVEFPRGRDGHREPLVVTGSEGMGDLLCVEYVDARHIKFLYDHWGAGSVASEAVEIDYAVAHELVVSFGGLLAGAETPPAVAAAARKLSVRLDGKTVMERAADFHLAEPDEIDVGANRIGGSSCERRFTGSILRADRLAAPRSEGGK